MSKFYKSSEDSLKKYTLRINRTAKVVKGGTNFSFSSLVSVGDGVGKFSIGFGKSKETSDATKKAMDRASKSLTFVPLKGKTSLYYPIIGKFSSSKVIITPSASGSGIKASKVCRSIFESIGLRDVCAKTIGSRNPLNVAKAVEKALLSIKTPRYNRKKRGIDFIKS